MASRRSTIRDIATRAGVGVATVDRVLHGRVAVREATAARVRAAAQALGYGAIPAWTGAPSGRPASRRVRAGFLLQREASFFYRDLAAGIEQAAREASAAGDVDLAARVGFCAEVEPAALAAAIRANGRDVDALAVVAIDHPLVGEAIAELDARGVGVVSLLTELSTPACRGHAGINNRMAGRTAGWAVARCAAAPGPIGVLIGSHGYLGQEDREIGFRSYLRERAPQFSVLEPIVTLDDPDLAEKGTIGLLRSSPLAAIYLAGGGEAGTIRALGAIDAQRRPTVVCHELSPHTRHALAAGVVAIALVQDPLLIARRAVALIAAIARGEEPARPFERLPFEIRTSENA